MPSALRASAAPKSCPVRRVALLASNGGVPCQDLGHGVAGAGERPGDEGSDQVAAGNRAQGLRAVVASQCPPQRGQVGGQIGEARVAGAVHDQHLTVGRPGQEPVARLQVARLLLAVILQPQEGRTKVPAAASACGRVPSRLTPTR
jgi:hypothetical protein